VKQARICFSIAPASSNRSGAAAFGQLTVIVARLGRLLSIERGNDVR